ncbi:ATP-binding protein [Streptomyces sp. HUAS ZL42]|uniref:ATP-binding protein n=1 Tax=Streptomyces sp. HUAS ZL42 TaxID=3231715 RepID=UPI00345E48DE
MDCTTCMPRRSWDLAFLAEPEDVAAVRRLLRTHLGLWGLPELIEAAQLCASELVGNVIKHVGPGTPTSLAVSMRGTCLRIEVHDPDARALPSLKEMDADSDTGRGVALVDTIADRWGVQLHPGRKVVWCELATGLTLPNGHLGGEGVTRAEVLPRTSVEARPPRDPNHSRLSMRVAEEAVINAITDLLHWLRAHGCDADEALDRAQTHFEVQIAETQGLLPHGAMLR